MTGEVPSGARTTRRPLGRVNRSNSSWVTTAAYVFVPNQFPCARLRPIMTRAQPDATARPPSPNSHPTDAPVLASPLSDLPCGTGASVVVVVVVGTAQSTVATPGA